METDFPMVAPFSTLGGHRVNFRARRKVTGRPTRPNFVDGSPVDEILRAISGMSAGAR
jgi:hypothetical protein